ncbi:MAG TPA: hypothetical protein VNL73_08460 [Verrucomicrobiae bacterium]|nr:hypothetical protein [Verrucomicrobiae bacterium]
MNSATIYSIHPTLSLMGSSINLAPKGNWLTEAQLKQFWINDETSRTSGSPLKVDGLLYTNNSIYGISRPASKTGGTMQVNGAIVAADVGLLVTNGLQMNYDGRLKSFLKIKDNSKIALINPGGSAKKKETTGKSDRRAVNRPPVLINRGCVIFSKKIRRLSLNFL